MTKILEMYTPLNVFQSQTTMFHQAVRSRKKGSVTLQAIIADAYLQLNQDAKAKEIIQYALQRRTETIANEADALPGEIPSSLLTNANGIPHLLLVVKDELAMKEGENPISSLYEQLELLWKYHTQNSLSNDLVWNEFVYRIERDLCTCWMRQRRLID